MERDGGPWNSMSKAANLFANDTPRGRGFDGRSLLIESRRFSLLPHPPRSGGEFECRRERPIARGTRAASKHPPLSPRERFRVCCDIGTASRLRSVKGRIISAMRRGRETDGPGMVGCNIGAAVLSFPLPPFLFFAVAEARSEAKRRLSRDQEPASSAREEGARLRAA